MHFTIKTVEKIKVPDEVAEDPEASQACWGSRGEAHGTAVASGGVVSCPAARCLCFLLPFT